MLFLRILGILGSFMAKIAFIVPPLTGHINPTVAMGQILEERGHDVCWIGHPSIIRKSLPPPYHIIPLSEDLNPNQLGSIHQNRNQRGLGAFQYLWEGVLIPLAEQSYPNLIDILQDLQPDLCIVDQQMLAGALACRQLELPWFTSATTSASLVNALETLPKIQQWLDEHIHALQVRLGLPPLPPEIEVDLSDEGILVFSSRSLTQSIATQLIFPPHYHFVGPALKVKRTPIEFPWQELRDDVPKIYLSLGTVNAERGQRFYDVASQALGELPLQVIASAPVHLFSNPPANFIVANRVPQLEILPKMDAVICHGGHNTTCEALSFGLPLLIAPIKDDQPIVAQQVEASGAGIRIKFGRIKPHQLKEALLNLLNTPCYRQSAQAIQREFQKGDGGEQAADRIENWLRLKNRKNPI